MDLEESFSMAALDVAEGDLEPDDRLVEFLRTHPKRDWPLSRFKPSTAILDTVPKLRRRDALALLRRGDPALAGLLSVHYEDRLLRSWVGRYVKPDQLGYVMDAYDPTWGEAALFHAVKEGLRRDRREMP